MWHDTRHEFWRNHGSAAEYFLLGCHTRFISSHRAENHSNGIPACCDGIGNLLFDFNLQPCHIGLELANVDQAHRVRATRKGSLLHADHGARKIEDQTVRLIQSESFIRKVTCAIHTYLSLLVLPAKVDLLNCGTTGIFICDCVAAFFAAIVFALKVCTVT